MRILVEQQRDDGTITITPLEQPDELWALRARGNPLEDDWDLPASGSGRIVCWSGSLADDLFESHPLTWLAPGHDALARFCDELAPQLHAQSRRLCFQPHARHVLSDPPSVLTFLQQRDGQPFDVLLSPAEMLEPSMLDTIEDHLVRMFEPLGGTAAGVVLHDVAVDAAGESCIAVPLGAGQLPAGIIGQLIDAYCPGPAPIIISGHAMQQQLAWLKSIGC